MSTDLDSASKKFKNLFALFQEALTIDITSFQEKHIIKLFMHDMQAACWKSTKLCCNISQKLVTKMKQDKQKLKIIGASHFCKI